MSQADCTSFRVGLRMSAPRALEPVVTGSIRPDELVVINLKMTGPGSAILRVNPFSYQLTQKNTDENVVQIGLTPYTLHQVLFAVGVGRTKIPF